MILLFFSAFLTSPNWKLFLSIFIARFFLHSFKEKSWDSKSEWKSFHLNSSHHFSAFEGGPLHIFPLYPQLAQCGRQWQLPQRILDHGNHKNAQFLNGRDWDFQLLSKEEMSSGEISIKIIFLKRICQLLHTYINSWNFSSYYFSFVCALCNEGLFFFHEKSPLTLL